MTDVEIPKIVKDKGYSGYLKTTSITADTAFKIMKEDAGIFAVHSHGSPYVVSFSDDSAISKYQIDDLPSGTLSDLDLVIYGTCSAGAGGVSGINIVNSTYNKGAKVVIGFEELTYINEMNQWLFDFFKSYFVFMFISPKGKLMSYAAPNMGVFDDVDIPKN